MAASMTSRYFSVRLIAIRFDAAILARMARSMRPRLLLMFRSRFLTNPLLSPFPKVL